MKTVKFMPELCTKIIAGEKTSTWRLFDDKNLQVGDNLEFVNKETGTAFGTAIISKMKITSLGGLTDEDWEGHERFESAEVMYATYRAYYGDKVSPDSELKIIHFNFTQQPNA